MSPATASPDKLRRMTITRPRRTWSVAPDPVDSAEGQALLRDYYIDVADRYYLLHFGDRQIRRGLLHPPPLNRSSVPSFPARRCSSVRCDHPRRA